MTRPRFIILPLRMPSGMADRAVLDRATGQLGLWRGLILVGTGYIECATDTLLVGLAQTAAAHGIRLLEVEH